MWSLIPLLSSELFFESNCTPSESTLSHGEAGGEAVLDDFGRFMRNIQPS